MISRAYGIKAVGTLLLEDGSPVEVPTWQSIDVTNRPQGQTHEVCDFVYRMEKIPATVEDLWNLVKPNMPWAENQFQERVGGKPLNPGETYKEWPWYKGNVEEHKEQGRFSHTYMERYWPKWANGGHSQPDIGAGKPVPHKGVWYENELGDLSDVVNLLAREPMTRQAYLPVFFPEDTGVVHRERIPCSLGYQFLMRKGKLNITYGIRSCDYYRHFRDDVYMTARLCQWVLERLQPKGEGRRLTSDEVDERAPMDTLEEYAARDWADITPGRLTMNIGSLHVFAGDLPRLRNECGDGQYASH